MENKGLQKDIYKVQRHLEESKELLEMWSEKEKVEWRDQRSL